MAQMTWEGACERVRSDDGLPVRKVGAWSEDKLHVWHKYIQTTTVAMVGKPAWKAGIYYVDLFAGPGVCTVADSGKRIPGSPIIAALAPKPFTRILMCELDPAIASACEKRMNALNATHASVFQGNSNDLVDSIAKEIPAKALTLGFLDPEGLDVHFETVERLASIGQVDLLILFADAYDALRNLESLLDGSDDRLDRMLGPGSNWKDEVRKLPNWEGNTLREYFSKKYIEQLKGRLGYAAADTKIIKGPKGPLYRLVYVSKHERGLDFWRKVDHRDRFGQAQLFS